jgi:hypothetical protein
LKEGAFINPNGVELEKEALVVLFLFSMLPCANSYLVCLMLQPLQAL